MRNGKIKTDVNQATTHSSFRIRHFPLICVAAVLFAAAHTVAQAPSADDIVAKYLAARGGAEKLRAVNTVKMTGKITGQPGEVEILSWAKRPNMMRRESKMKGQTQIVASDGQSVWTLNSLSPNPREVTGPQADAAKVEASEFDPVLLDSKEKGHKIELVGKEPVDGIAMYHLRVTKKNGPTQDIYLNADTLLESRMTMNIDQGPRKGTASIDFSNFKAVDGIMVPFKIRQSFDGQPVAEVTYDSVQFNAAVDDSLFRMPSKLQKP
jgi:outer membrane lipoprotein-sorting protein